MSTFVTRRDLHDHFGRLDARPPSPYDSTPKFSLPVKNLSSTVSRLEQVQREAELSSKLKKACKEIEELKSFIENELKSVMESIKDDH